MPGPTTNQGLILPFDGDLNQVPADMAAYNSGVEGRLVQRYDNAVDRGVRNPAPQEGEVSYLRSEDGYEWYNGSAWVTLFSGSPWQTYVPTWGTVAGAASTIGNGSITGRYQQIGKTVHFMAQITMGSTTTYAVNQWTLTPPVPAVTSSTLRPIINTRVFLQAAANAFLGVSHFSTSTTLLLDTQANGTPGTDPIRQGFPATFQAGDAVQLSGTYEAL